MSELYRRDGATVVQRGDLRLLLDPSSLVDREMLDHGAWEATQIGLMIDAARALKGNPRRKLFLDVGAYWGLYSLKMWRLGVFDEILCFEPDANNFAQLEAQMFLNGASYDIKRIKAAVLDKPGTARLLRSTSIADGNRGGAMIQESSEDSEPVQVVTLDELLDVKGAILFVKIDVEGSEARVLAGMRRLLAENEIYLQVEVFPGFEDRLKDCVPDTLTKVAQHHWDHMFSNLPPLPLQSASASALHLLQGNPLTP